MSETSPLPKYQPPPVAMLKRIKYRNALDRPIVPVPSIDIHVIGCGGTGSPRAVCINTTTTKYLFNCGEGTQRIINEHKMRLSTFENIFITNKTWDNMGGILGFCLSLEGVNLPAVTIHGPSQLQTYIEMSSHFATLKQLNIRYQSDEGSFDDNTLNFRTLRISAEEEEESGDIDPPNKRVRLSEASEICYAYVCKPEELQGALCLEKCVELGVPRGPLFARLKSGETITLENGKVVGTHIDVLTMPCSKRIEPADILKEVSPSDAILVVDCPTVSYLQSLKEKLSEYLTCSDSVVHLAPVEVVATPQYQQWMHSFRDSTKHLVVNNTEAEVVLEGVYKMQASLNMIDNSVFPLLSHSTQIKKAPEDESLRVIATQPNFMYHYRGRCNDKVDRSRCFNIDNEKYREEALQDNQAKLMIEKLPYPKHSLPEGAVQYPELLFLGTGSSIPCKIRNVSSIWLNLSTTQSLLMDCGENTYGQLYRHYGEQRTAVMLGQLSTVFVSHLHSDHHNGLVGLVKARSLVNNTPLNIIIPAAMQKWFESFSQCIEPIEQFINIIPMENLYTENECKDSLLKTMNLKQLSVPKVKHSQYPHGLVVQHERGWKLVYSGDTMPCHNLVEHGKNCDILIHEATMEDDLEELAKLKRHSTVGQAIEVSRQMNAGFVLLTHFSQRYSKLPHIDTEFGDNVGIAFDNMKVSADTLKRLPVLLPVIKELFSKSCKEMTYKNEKRRFKKEILEKNNLSAAQ